MTTTEEENKELVRGFVNEILVDGDWDRVDEYVAEDFVSHTVAAPEDIRGREAHREFYTGVQSAFPDMGVQIKELIADDKVAQHSRQTGTHDGEFMDMEPTGNTFDVEGIIIYRIKDGKIAEEWVQADMMGMMEQLGVK